jgi:glycosyltransferase involved in cell wall biosynthesis
VSEQQKQQRSNVHESSSGVTGSASKQIAALQDLRVAIVHDWLIGGGAERVVLTLHNMYPEAPIYTSYCTDEWRKKLDNKVVTGYLQKGPFPKLRKFIPVLRAIWFSNLNLKGYDLVISSSGAEAKAVKVPKNTLHINYCHSPTHYYWVRYDEYITNPGFGPFNWLARIGLRLLVMPMRWWDRRAAQRPNLMIANSNYTKDNIKKYYGRDSKVIHPPVDVDRFKLKGDAGAREGYLVAGRQTPYMRKDLAVAACSRLGLPLLVIGNGPEHNKLVKLAGPTITFLTNVSDEEMPKFFNQARAFIMPGMEDFGITAVEAMAAGAPVIALRAGGALDYVKTDKTGVFFNEQTVDAVAQAIQAFIFQKFNNVSISKTTARFSVSAFEYNMRHVINKEFNR